MQKEYFEYSSSVVSWKTQEIWMLELWQSWTYSKWVQDKTRQTCQDWSNQKHLPSSFHSTILCWMWLVKSLYIWSTCFWLSWQENVQKKDQETNILTDSDWWIGQERPWKISERSKSVWERPMGYQRETHSETIETVKIPKESPRHQQAYSTIKKPAKHISYWVLIVQDKQYRTNQQKELKGQYQWNLEWLKNRIEWMKRVKCGIW